MKILIVDDDELVRLSLKSSLEDSSLRGASELCNSVTTADTFSSAKNLLSSEIFDLAFVDIRLGPHHKRGGIELLKYIRQLCPTTVVIMMTSIEDYETIEKCLLLGAADYVFKPFDYQCIHLLMAKARVTHRHFRKQQNLKTQAGENAIQPIHLKTQSPLFQKVLNQAKRLKHTNLSVLLLGENGVGKEVLAQYLWTLEDDDARPFVAVHSGGLSKELVESEIFGHKRGSFTGAIEDRMGKFQLAHRGDFFLDEIATMTPEVQQRLLRVLQEKKVTPIGSNATVSVDCRIICATNENLENLVKNGSFREDLYFRIKRAVLNIPPLRHRREDIPALIEHFLNKFSLGTKRLSRNALRLCLEYDWPGNIRQLEGALETTAKMQEGVEITEDDLRTQLFSQSESWDSPRPPADQVLDVKFGLDEENIHRNYRHLLREFEQTMVGLALKKVKSENAAAEYLGLPRSTLVSRRKSWGWKESGD